MGSTYIRKCSIWCWVFFRHTFIQPYRGICEFYQACLRVQLVPRYHANDVRESRCPSNNRGERARCDIVPRVNESVHESFLFDHENDFYLYRIFLFWTVIWSYSLLFSFYICRYIFISSPPDEPRLVHHSIVVTNSTFLKRQNSTIRFVSDRS